MNHLQIPYHIYQDIMDSIGSVPTESGGVMAIQGNVISDYYFDADAGVGKRFYRPSTELITKRVNTWVQEGKSFCGFIHSHTYPYTQLSAMDVVAAEKTLLLNQMPAIYMAILCHKRLYFYRVFYPQGQKQSVIEPCTIEIKNA